MAVHNVPSSSAMIASRGSVTQRAETTSPFPSSQSRLASLKSMPCLAALILLFSGSYSNSTKGEYPYRKGCQSVLFPHCGRPCTTPPTPARVPSAPPPATSLISSFGDPATRLSLRVSLFGRCGDLSSASPAVALRSGSRDPLPVTLIAPRLFISR